MGQAKLRGSREQRIAIAKAAKLEMLNVATHKLLNDRATELQEEPIPMAVVEALPEPRKRSLIVGAGISSRKNSNMLNMLAASALSGLYK